MQQRTYGKLGYSVSALGLGCMRLPRIYDGSDKAKIDRDKAIEIIQYAAQNGINYFDTAFTYHHGESEDVLGEALESIHMREKVKVVTKQLFGYMKTQGDIRRNLETALKRLRTDYLDVYLVHSIGPASWPGIQERKIFEEYEKFRAEGLIRAIGFSYHGPHDTFSEVLSSYDWDMCQVQQNILDINYEATEKAIFDAGKKGVALAIMEPLRGGGLASPPESVREIYNAAPVQRSAVDWAFRHLLNYPEVSVVLSGMSTLAQLKENIEIFSKKDAVSGCLSAEEQAMLTRVREAYESLATVPCTGCEYCMPCPQHVAISSIFQYYNEGVMFDNFSQPQRAYMLLERINGTADHCVSCGDCEAQCPQHIPIAERLKAAHEVLKGWIE
ncbi:aldo/keto reductase [Christensenellaceae bacterium OttesenSCG-928-L17]|nr:aldo/keto reductase [Christensenellaceae bacterium OttesenSCG-928-L17]